MSEDPVDFAALRAFRVFQPLTEDEGAALVGRTRVVTLPAGEILFRQGDQGDSLYLLVAGQIEVRAEGQGVPDYSLATLEAGAMLGELALLINVSRTVTAIAVTDAELWEIDRESCQDGIDAGQRWANLLVLGIAQGLAGCLRAVNGQLLATIASLDDRDEATDATRARVAELELLRNRLVAEWTF